MHADKALFRGKTRNSPFLLNQDSNVAMGDVQPTMYF